MSTTIGPWTFEAQDSKIATLRPMAELLAKRFQLPDGTYRVLPATVVLKPRNEMPWASEPGEDPKYPNGVRAQGYWFSKPHRMELNEALVPTLLIRTFAHEAIHHLDDDWLRKTNKQDIKLLFSPKPSGFPSEPYAVHASAALGGFTNPPYKTFYPTPKMAEANYAKLAAFSLRDDRPVDPCADLRAENAQLKTDIAELTEQLAEANRQNADLLSALSVAKGYAQGIEVKAAEIDSLAKQIEAL